MIWVIINIIIVAWIILSNGIQVVKPFEKVTVNRSGKYHKTLTEGIYFINPLTSKVVKREIISDLHQIENVQSQIVNCEKNDANFSNPIIDGDKREKY